MRRVVSVLLASIFLIALATPVAADATPIDERRVREDVPLDATLLELPGGEFCDFDLRVEDIAGDVTYVFITEDRHGNILERIIFHTIAEYTNLDTGESFQMRYDSVVNATFRPDGSAKYIIRNDALVFYLEGEVHPFGTGRGVWLVDKGRVVEEYSDTGLVLSRLDEAGSVLDVCAAVS
ncbi:MAG: hypothetical protein ACT4OQ_11795 [Chloroflexota bacterium]